MSAGTPRPGAERDVTVAPRSSTMTRVTEFFEAIQPGLAHWRRQRELEKVLVVEAPSPGEGPQPLDLESGVVTIVRKPHQQRDDDHDE